MPRSVSKQFKRNSRARASKNAHKRKKILNEINNAVDYVPEDAHIEYFKS